VRLTKRADGLYVFPFEVRFRSTVRKFNGLIDTGSNVCAGTYEIFTTLRARQTAYDKIGSPLSLPAIRYIGYSLKLKIDDHSIMTTFYRLPLKMPGINLILGNPVLRLCKMTAQGNDMDLTWITPPGS
jgi:hypothetical protein